MLVKLGKYLFYVFLFLIPFQIRTALYWEGDEWNSVFLYLSDILLIAVFLLAILQREIKFKKTDLFLFLFIGVAGLSLFVSSNLEISIYRFIKLLEFVLLYIYIRSNTGFLKLKNVFAALIASGVFQSILAIAQFLKQGSLGLKYIEAGVYSPGAPGVATFIMGSEKIMRAYGSFPHPNVLAGFLLLVIFCLYALWLRSKKISWLLIICYLLLVFSFFLTFSRGALLVFLIMSLIFFLFRFFQTRFESICLAGSPRGGAGRWANNIRMLRMGVVKLFGLFLISCLISIILLAPYLKARFFTISLEEQAIDLRFFYDKMAIAMIKDKPFLGVGIGNFVNYSENYQPFLRAANKMLSLVGEGEKGIPQWLFQPVHNIYLLIGAEIGAVGLLIFLLFIIMRIIRIPIRMTRIDNPFLFLFVGFLVLAMSDHYFWTLQQGGLMFWLALALLGPHSLMDKTSPSGGEE